MRVYEFSKKNGLSSKDVLRILNILGYKSLTNISVIPPAMADEIELLIMEHKKVDNVIKFLESQKEKDSSSKSENSKNLNNKNLENKIYDSNNPIEIELKPIKLFALAKKINKNTTDIILDLLKQGIAVNINQTLSEDTLLKLSKLYNFNVISKSANKDLTKNYFNSKNINIENFKSSDLKERPPIVVIIGHVDHGKTTLLDYIRQTRVALKEKGGITQHLGAYEAHTSHGDIIFLDTPGHEAFSFIRARGTKVADIAVLIVAADDGVMPQTIEALKYAQNAALPIIVAINKIDKVDQSRFEIIKTQLSQYGLLAESWGGDTIFVPISAKFGTGVSELLDLIILQSKLMELKANLNISPQCFILESSIKKGRGPVATVICHHGILNLGDYFKAGDIYGKVTSMVDSYGKKVNKIYPSIPVQVSGFNSLPNVGDLFQVISNDEYKKEYCNIDKLNKLDLTKSLNEDSYNIIIKADNLSTKEALLNSIEKLSKKTYKPINVLYSSISDITDSDIQLAYDTNTPIYSLHVKISPNSLQFLQKHPIKIKSFDIIYKLLEELEKDVNLLKPVKMISKKIGEALVLKIFNIKNLGVVAGSKVISGRFIKDAKVEIFRRNKKIGSGIIKGLQRDKKSVKEVHAGFECGILLDGFSDFEIDDKIECFEDIPENN
jgi:translation initiation factor IF-2